MKKLALHWKILIGLVLGIVWAFISISFGLNKFTTDWISPFGEIFLNLLKLIAIPLVMFSIITGIADLSDLTKLGRMGTKTILIFLLTSSLAISTGLSLVNIIKPGTSIPEEQRIKNRISYEIWRDNTPNISAVDEINLSTDPKYSQILDDVTKGSEYNIEQSYIDKKIESAQKQKEESPLKFLVDIVPDNIVISLSDSTLLLQVIFFSILFGISIKKIPEKHSEILSSFFSALNQIYLKMVDMIMISSPFFVFALMAGSMSDLASNSDELIQVLSVLLKYSLVVVLGLSLLLFVFYPLLFIFFGYQENKERNFIERYLHYFKSLAPAQLLAFSTSSSAATLPVTYECVNNNLKISKDTTSFVLPIGATINMDGTALYQAVAIIFLAQFHFIDLTIAQQFTILLTTVLASIGAASIPSAGLIMLIMVLQSVHLNPAWIAIILPIDRILDMCRTVINVSGDALTASIVEKAERNSSEKAR